VKLVVGLGNPGREYEQTRHNVGWMLLDRLAQHWHANDWRRDADARVADALVGGTRVRLLKPLTYMNLSGQALRPYQRRETWAAARDLLVVVDEVALPLGRYRLRAQGSAGGHNGLRSVEAALGTREYARLRIGIHPEDPRRRDPDLADFVLARFGRDEAAQLDELFPRLIDAVDMWLHQGIVAAMNAHNRRPLQAEDEAPDESA
jgi:peptidyl-tRNA hydrolase, PTH1 family